MATSAPVSAGPAPLRWTADEFDRMVDLGLLGDRRCELADGELLEHVADGRRPVRFSRREYFELGKLSSLRGRRIELIRGVVIEKPPMNEPHARSVLLVTEEVRAAFGSGHCFRVQVPLDCGTSTPHPDVCVVPGKPRDYADTPPAAVARLVVEVADDSVFNDTTTKAEVYAEAGVPDYWVVDIPASKLVVFRDPAPIAANGHSYRSVRTIGPNDAVSPLAVPGAVVRVADLLP